MSLKRGQLRDDGFIFDTYYYVVTKHSGREKKERWLSPEAFEHKRAQRVRWWQLNRDKHITNIREDRLQRQYGISVADYDRMLNEQAGGCAICNKLCKSGVRLAVDHDHSTQKVRGLLCANCNTALGKFSDSKELLERAIQYLETNSVSRNSC